MFLQEAQKKCNELVVHFETLIRTHSKTGVVLEAYIIWHATLSVYAKRTLNGY